MSRMTIKIINENPRDVVQFMIDYLREEEMASKSNEFGHALARNIGKRKVVVTEELAESGYGSRSGYGGRKMEEMREI